MIEELDPDSYEAPCKGDNAISYGIGPSKMKEAYCYIMPQKEYLNFGFFYGASLADEKKLLDGTGKSMRHVKIRKIEDLNDPAVRQLVLDAIQNRRNARQAQ